MKKRRVGKRKWLIGGLLIYGVALAIYFFVFSSVPNSLERYLTMGGFFVLVFILNIVLKKKEEMAKERNEDIEHNKEDN